MIKREEVTPPVCPGDFLHGGNFVLYRVQARNYVRRGDEKMANVSKSQFFDVLDNCRRIGFMAGIDMVTGKAELISRQSLEEITSGEVEISLFEAPFFRTYDVVYREKLEERMVRVMLIE